VNARHICGLAAVVVCATSLVGAQQATFRSGADAVRVDVQVKQGNRPVGGLRAEHFELRDSGVRQKIEAIAIEDVPVSLLLALDVSDSVRGPALEHLKNAARAAVAPLGPKDQALLLTFSERLTLRADWTSDRVRLEAAIGAIEPAGGTSLEDAIATAINLRQRASGRTLLLVFTDGVDTTSWLEPAMIADGVKQSDLVVYAVSSAGPRNPNNARESEKFLSERLSRKRHFQSEPMLFPEALLDTIADDSGGEMLYAAGHTDLARVFASVVSDFKSRYLLTYSPQGVPATGWHPIEVKLRGARGTVTARRGYSR
jgi:VWFA-related protein